MGLFSKLHNYFASRGKIAAAYFLHNQLQGFELDIEFGLRLTLGIKFGLRLGLG